MEKIYDITRFEYKRELTKRYLYPFYSLNKLTGGAEVSALNILFAKTNQGKSEVSMQFMTQWIKDGHKVCAMLGEHSMRKAQSLLYKKVSMYNSQTWETKKIETDGRYTGISETFISEEDEKKAIDFYKGNLYLYDTRNGFKLEDIIGGFEDGLKRGCDVFLLDNGMLLDLETNNELLEQRDNTERLRQWAKHNQVVVFLILHARKVEYGRIRLSEYDIAGSSNIPNKGTTIMSITRTDLLNPNTKEYKDYQKLLELNKINLEECDAIIEVVKEKNGRCGFVPLKWYESTKTYREVYNKENEKEEKPVLFVKQELIPIDPDDDLFSSLPL
jgi:hypothetical protein